MSVYIIAEAGVNHNGSLDMALKLVETAVEAGADAVKFQTFKAERVISKNAPKAEYQKHTTGSNESQLEMVRRLELGKEAHREVQKKCIEYGIDFLSTPFDLESLDFLVRDLGLRTLKIPSGEITNAPFLLRAARTGCNIYMSTGMSTLGEIEVALGVLAFGLLDGNGPPSQKAFEESYFSEMGKEALKQKVTLLHCTTEYPAPFKEVNLNVLQTLRKAFELPVGYSDHTEGIAVPIAAAALGARIIEKHFTLDRELSGPDHRASLEPRDLCAMVQGIRQVEIALGSSRKIPSNSECLNRSIVRKSIIAGRNIKAGEVLKSEDIEIKRPGEGISPMRYWDFIGRAVLHDSHEDSYIKG